MQDTPYGPRETRPFKRGGAEECWPWQGSFSIHGYGVVVGGRRQGNAHRFVYEEERGSIPDGLDLDHLCRNRACVNPAHMEPVTRAENLRRGRGTKLVRYEVFSLRLMKMTTSVPVGSMAELCGVDASTVYQLLKGQTWRDL